MQQTILHTYTVRVPQQKRLDNNRQISHLLPSSAALRRTKNIMNDTFFS